MNTTHNAVFAMGVTDRLTAPSTYRAPVAARELRSGLLVRAITAGETIDPVRAI
jgi:hypothetical protein